MECPYVQVGKEQIVYHRHLFHHVDDDFIIKVGRTGINADKPVNVLGIDLRWVRRCADWHDNGRIVEILLVFVEVFVAPLSA